MVYSVAVAVSVVVKAAAVVVVGFGAVVAGVVGVSVVVSYITT